MQKMADLAPLGLDTDRDFFHLKVEFEEDLSLQMADSEEQSVCLSTFNREENFIHFCLDRVRECYPEECDIDTLLRAAQCVIDRIFSELRQCSARRSEAPAQDEGIA